MRNQRQDELRAALLLLLRGLDKREVASLMMEFFADTGDKLEFSARCIQANEVLPVQARVDAARVLWEWQRRHASMHVMVRPMHTYRDFQAKYPELDDRANIVTIPHPTWHPKDF